MRGTYVGNNKMLVSTIYNRHIFAHADDLSLMPLLVSQGGFEIPLTKFFIEQVKHGHVVIDVGANIGYFTVLLANLVGGQGKVYAYEAAEKNYRILMENLQINYVQEKVEVLKKAVHSEKGNITFYACDKFSGNGSTILHDEKYQELYQLDTIHEEIVEAEPLDLYGDTYEKIDFVKIDVEGGEYNVFLGMERLLKEGKVGHVIFEMNKLRLGNQAENFFDLLRTYEKEGYGFYLLNEHGHLLSAPLEKLFEREFIDNVVMKKR